MRLLLDAMFAPEIAIQLRRRGHDALGVDERADLRWLDDRSLFEFAQGDRRAMVTNNVNDFVELDALYRSLGRVHHGLILTSDRRFRRAFSGAIGPLVLALDSFLQTQSTLHEPVNLIHWLQ